jgi:membrane dipeptidase
MQKLKLLNCIQYNGFLFESIIINHPVQRNYCIMRSNEEDLARRADKLHKVIMNVDTHCDTPMSLVSSGFDLGLRHDEGCVDFPRMNEGGLDAEFFAVFIAGSAK